MNAISYAHQVSCRQDGGVLLAVADDQVTHMLWQSRKHLANEPAHTLAADQPAQGEDQHIRLGEVMASPDRGRSRSTTLCVHVRRLDTQSQYRHPFGRNAEL